MIEVDESRGFVYSALQLVFGFQHAGFGGDQTEDNGLAFGYESQGLETACALRVVLQEVAVHIDVVEQKFGDRVISALPFLWGGREDRRSTASAVVL